MDKRTLELLHSKLSDLDSKIAEISSLRKEIFDILKDHESKQQAEADAAALVDEASDKADAKVDEQLNLAQIKTKVDEAVQDDLEDDDNALGQIGDIDSERDVIDEAQKAKEDIEREAIALEAQKLMHSAPDDVEPMRQEEEALQDDINGENGDNENANSIDMVNNPQTISTIDPTIIPQKVLDQDLDVGPDSDLAKVNDAFAEMDRIESQEDIDKMDEGLSQDHDHSDLVASETPEKVDQEKAPEKVEEKKVEDKKVEPSVQVKEEEKTVIDTTAKATPTPVAKVIEEEKTVIDNNNNPSAVEEDAVVVQPRPMQKAAQTSTTPASNQGTLNAGRSTGLKVDEMLSRQNSRNLYKAFTLNDKFRFRRELFHGKDVEMAQALDRISLMDNYGQAEDYFYETLGLNSNNEDVKDFMLIIKNHFASL